MESSTLKLVSCEECEQIVEAPCAGCVLGAFGKSIDLLDGVLIPLKNPEARSRFWQMLHDYSARRIEVLK
jgi:hypothetical protein